MLTEEKVLGRSLTELVQFTWTLVVKMQEDCATSVDVETAQDLARELNYLCDYYDKHGGSQISSTTLFMAREVSHAVTDVSNKHPVASKP